MNKLGKNRNRSFIPFPFRWILSCSFISLILGMAIYILFRPPELLFFDWVNNTGLYGSLESIRSKSVLWNSFLPDWFIFSLPNGLWAFSYSLLMIFLWSKSTAVIKYFWIGSIPLVVFGFELLQFSGNLPGTFCRHDLIFLAVGMGGGILLGTKTTKNKNHEKKST